MSSKSSFGDGQGFDKDSVFFLMVIDNKGPFIILRVFFSGERRFENLASDTNK